MAARHNTRNLRAVLAVLLWGTAFSAGADTSLFSVPLGGSEVHLTVSVRYLQDGHDGPAGDACAFLHIVIPLRRPRASWVFPIRDWRQHIDASVSGR